MSASCTSAALGNDLFLLDARFPERIADTGHGMVSYRSCGSGPAIVLLHGIGSGAASWMHCALRLEREARVIAWNAPGYGRSTPLDAASPGAADYAARLEAFLAALGIEHCLLVGHSLGALMGAAYAARDGTRAQAFLMLSPAQGYGSTARRARGEEVLRERLDTLQRLGVEGMAEHRSARLVSHAASDTARAWVRWNMSQLDPAGYSQAVRLLCGSDIHDFLPPRIPAAVACGEADDVTTPQDSARLAAEAGLPYQGIPGAGHACYVEQPEALSELIRSTFQLTLQSNSHE
jgi:pimeloyl-ACP methyl ester carboxylesterase